jgi:hypothetical protein
MERELIIPSHPIVPQQQRCRKPGKSDQNHRSSPKPRRRFFHHHRRDRKKAKPNWQYQISRRRSPHRRMNQRQSNCRARDQSKKTKNALTPRRPTRRQPPDHQKQTTQQRPENGNHPIFRAILQKSRTKPRRQHQSRQQRRRPRSQRAKNLRPPHRTRRACWNIRIGCWSVHNDDSCLRRIRSDKLTLASEFKTPASEIHFGTFYQKPRLRPYSQLIPAARRHNRVSKSDDSHISLPYNRPAGMTSIADNSSHID